jgi:PilZ domain
MSEEQEEVAEQAVEVEQAVETEQTAEAEQAVEVEQTAEAEGREQRKSIRFRINMGVQVRLSSGTVVRTQGKNISIGGIYVEFEAPADLGDEFEMMFDVPLSNEIKRVFVRSKVTRSALIGGKDVYGIAFQFLSFAKETEQILEEYLNYRELQQSSSPL